MWKKVEKTLEKTRNGPSALLVSNWLINDNNGNNGFQVLIMACSTNYAISYELLIINLSYLSDMLWLGT